jgi:hypothetical protein
MSDIFFDEMKIPKPDYFLGIGGKASKEIVKILYPTNNKKIK